MMKKIVLTFGLISGAVLSVMLLATVPFMERIGDAGMVLGYATMVAASFLIYFGVRSYRDNVAGGRVSFGRALAVGSLIALVQGLCYTATWEAYYFTAHPDILSHYHARQIEGMREQGATQAAIEAKVVEQRRWAELYENPVVNAGMTLMEPLPVGLLFALVSAGLLSRRRRDLAASLSRSAA
jgi:hypothetical protein